MQQLRGPRIFLKETWYPPAHDYHLVLHGVLEAGGLPIGEITSAGEAKDVKGERSVFVCAVCTNEIDVPFDGRLDKLYFCLVSTSVC